MAVTTSAHDTPVNPVNVAVPVPDELGVTVLPPILYEYVTVVPEVPPDHDAINPVAVTDEDAREVIAVGIAYVVAEPVTFPLEFVAVIVSGQLAVAVKLEIVALVVVKLETVGVLPVTAKVNVTALAATPPDQLTLNEDAVQAENVMPVIALGRAQIVTPALETTPPVALYARLSSVMTSNHEFPVKPEKVVGLVPLVENPVPEPPIV